MLSFILLLLLLTITVLVIMVLRKNQQKHTSETVDRTAPLPALGDNALPDFAPLPVATVADFPASDTPVADVLVADTVADAIGEPVKASDNWQLQVKNLRATQQYAEALEICRSQYPKAQAFQQAAIILRQQIKISQEQNTEFDPLLQALYSLAALADVYISGGRHEGFAVTQIEAALRNIKDKYPILGYQQLKLLNKSDIRLLEQAWGKPDSHCHAEEL